MEKKVFGFRTWVLVAAFLAVCAWSVPFVLAQPIPGGTLDPLGVPKFEDPLVIPPVMPPAVNGKKVEFHIGVRQIEQTMLPASMGLKTKVFAYGPADDSNNERFFTPSLTIEANMDQIIRVEWVNQLADASSNFLPHLLPVDQTLHWANPGGGENGKDMTPSFLDTPGPYQGPVPVSVHVHGSHVADHSDGYPEAWFLPYAENIPASFATKGTHYNSLDETDLVNPIPGKALFEYENDQRATTLWYHDHTIGMTRVNVYSGMAGFYLIRDKKPDGLSLPGPAPKLGDPMWQPQRTGEAPPFAEIPLAIQDRSFNADGSLFYADSRSFFDGHPGPYLPHSDIPPIWNPEFFGNMMVVNGRTWPYLNVEPKKYRFRMLNASGSRFLVLKFNQAGLPFTVVGNDGGFLRGAPVTQDQLLMGPAERYDVIVDFSQFAPGTEIVLLNLGPDEPFGGFPIEVPSDPETTGLVMKFKVVPLGAPDKSKIPAKLPDMDKLKEHTVLRELTLNEHAHQPNANDPEPFDGPIAALLGTVNEGPLHWEQPITETPVNKSTEIWRVINLTEDAHPVHLHLVEFEILGRTPIEQEAFVAAQDAWLAAGKAGPAPDVTTFATGPETPPEPWEAGAKDTVIAYPGQFTMIKAKFDKVGLYVWHCHILEHEDNEMMRPLKVLP